MSSGGVRFADKENGLATNDCISWDLYPMMCSILNIKSMPMFCICPKMLVTERTEQDTKRPS